MTFIFLLSFFLIAIGAGTTIVHGLDRKAVLHRPEVAVTGFGIGCLLIYWGVAIIGPFRLDPLSVGGVLAAAALVALPSWVAWAGLLGTQWQMLRDAAIAWCRANPWAALVWGAIGLSLLSLLLQGLAPPNDYDSLSYHIALSKRDVEQGFIGPDWQQGLFSFFPALSENLYRIALVMAGEAAAQPVTGLFGVMLAVGTHALARRLGLGVLPAALAAAMTISVRASIWELATCEVEVILAFYAVSCLLTYLAWRDHGGAALMALFGLAAASTVATKYLGLAIGLGLTPAILWHLARRWRSAPLEIAVAIAVVVIVLAPHGIRNAIYTGNPIFPVFHHLIHPEAPAFFRDFGEDFGRPRGLLNFLRVYWDVSVLPTYYFDGAMLGAPYLLAFAPLALGGRRLRAMPSLLLMIVIYTVVWYLQMSQQARFLIPITPLFAILAASGAHWLWTSESRVIRRGAMVIAAILAINQIMFVSIYSILRVPAGIGLMDRVTYLTRTPTMNDNFYLSCEWINRNLGPDERIVSLITPHSYYCTQSRAYVFSLPGEENHWLTGRPLVPLTPRLLADSLEAGHIRYVIAEVKREVRGGPDSAPQTVYRDLSQDRLGALLTPAFADIAPEFTDSLSAVYDAPKIIAHLRNRQAG